MLVLCTMNYNNSLDLWQKKTYSVQLVSGLSSMRVQICTPYDWSTRTARSVCLKITGTFGLQFVRFVWPFHSFNIKLFFSPPSQCHSQRSFGWPAGGDQRRPGQGDKPATNRGVCLFFGRADPGVVVIKAELLRYMHCMYSVHILIQVSDELIFRSAMVMRLLLEPRRLFCLRHGESQSFSIDWPTNLGVISPGPPWNIPYARPVLYTANYLK